MLLPVSACSDMAQDKVVTTGKEGSARTMHDTRKSLPETQVMQHVVFVMFVQRSKFNSG